MRGINRIKFTLNQVDFVRLDHFRGFESFWRIPADQDTAVNGKWVPGPGNDFFYELEKEISSTPIIAEDLGVITKEVDSLRKKFNFPGMRILQFAFDNHLFTEKRFLPHNYLPNTVVYTGTHDNDTLIGWWESKDKKIKKKVIEYLNSSEEQVISNIIRLAWQSVAFISIIPMQDLIRLDSEARMNLPGSLLKNWEWRFKWSELKEKYVQELKKFTLLYERN